MVSWSADFENCVLEPELFLLMAVALTLGQFHIKRAIVVWTADIIQWPLAGAVPVALPLAKERQHACIICHEDDLTFCITAEC
jgi:hypothetical protein